MTDKMNINNDQEESNTHTPVTEEKNIFDKVFPFISSIITISLTIMFTQSLFTTDISKINKKDIHAQLSIAISNDADLRVVNNIYSNRSDKRGLIDKFGLKSDNEDYYDKSVSLSEILENIRSEQYYTATNGNELDKSFINKLDIIIDEHTKINPFDNLDDNQKEKFESIRTILGSDYTLIENDINRVADDLVEQNALVKDYLGDSKLSLRLSIVALVVSLLTSIPQVVNTFLSYKKKKTIISYTASSDNRHFAA